MLDVYADLQYENETLKRTDNVDKDISQTLDQIDEYKRKFEEL